MSSTNLPVHMSINLRKTIAANEVTLIICIPDALRSGGRCRYVCVKSLPLPPHFNTLSAAH